MVKAAVWQPVPGSEDAQGEPYAYGVSLDEHGDVVLETVVQGDTVRKVLNYVQYNSQTLLDEFRKDVELAVREQRVGYEEAGRLLKFYEDGLNGYTYLEQ